MLIPRTASQSLAVAGGHSATSPAGVTWWLTSAFATSRPLVRDTKNHNAYTSQFGLFLISKYSNCQILDFDTKNPYTSRYILQKILQDVFFWGVFYLSLRLFFGSALPWRRPSDTKARQRPGAALRRRFFEDAVCGEGRGAEGLLDEWRPGGLKRLGAMVSQLLLCFLKEIQVLVFNRGFCRLVELEKISRR